MNSLRRTSRFLPAAALAGLVAATGGCVAGPGEPTAAWPPRLDPATERMQAAETGSERRDRAMDESGTTVLMDRPYH